MPDIRIRSETPTETCARVGAEAPIAAFLVVEVFAGSGAAVIREHELPSLSQADFLRDLAAGQWDSPHRILFIDEARGICRDASTEIANLLLGKEGAGPLGNGAHDFCIRHAAQSAA